MPWWGCDREELISLGRGCLEEEELLTLVRIRQCLAEEDRLRESLVPVRFRDKETSLEEKRAVRGIH